MQNFKIYGCACRCLIELAKRNDREIKEEDLLEEFSSKFSQWFRRPGLMGIFSVCRLVQELGIAKDGLITSRQDRIIEFQKHYNDKSISGILVFTETPSDHCLLLLEADANGIKVWNPYQDGSSKEEPRSWTEWDSMKAYGLILL